MAVYVLSADGDEEKKGKISFLWLGLSLAWMAVIYAFSAQAHSGDITKVYLHEANVPIRKFGHFSEFGLLAHFYARALLAAWPGRVKKSLLLALTLAASWAALDEFHQSFVPGRSALFTDVLVDASGAALFTVIFALWLRRRALGRSTR